MSEALDNIKQKRILFSPLNWGLGHVTRSIPVIKKLVKNNEVIICCDEAQEKFYREYFKDIWYIPHKGYPFSFTGSGNWTKEMLQNFKQLRKFKKAEQIQTEKWVKEFKIDIVISDQRYGFYSKKVKSIFITHQVNLPLKFGLLHPGQWLNKFNINNFNEVWIPDFENYALSGKMSKVRRKKYHFIGPQTRFSSKKKKKDKKYKFLCIISGPNPYAQKLYDELVEQLSERKEKSLMVVPDYVDTGKIPIEGNLTYVTSPTLKAFESLFDCSEYVVSRAGYSTLMDLQVTKNKAILIPTPGQHEQVYLAELHKEHKDWVFLKDVNGIEIFD